MTAPIFLDLSHTSHTRAHTGIQRVCRSLRAALGSDALAITHDPYAGIWRRLEPWEEENLAADSATEKRGAHWPVSARLRGRAQRWFNTGHSGSTPLPDCNAAGLIVPEVFSSAVASALPVLRSAVRGPSVAVFHDAIALKFPELTPAKTVARFPGYLRELLQFDGIAAVSEDSHETLLDYWRWLGVKQTPPVIALPWAIDRELIPADASSENPPLPVVLSVGSIEGRKNHFALLEACERLWTRGLRFELHLVGLAQPQTGRAALERIRTLQATGRTVRYDGPVSDRAVEAAYARCSFTVYPSLMEGFGLPVIESLTHGKPCVCSARGALGESARGGGCVALESMDATNLAIAIARLLEHPADVNALAVAARAREFRSWSDYAAELRAWMGGLSMHH